MSLLDDFARVSRARICPVCQHPDWCMVSRDDPPSRAICARVESPRRWREAGWLHRLRDIDDGRRVFTPRTRRLLTVALNTAGTAGADGDLLELARRARAAVRPEAAATLAEVLGVSVRSLERLRLGWTGRSWSFPMRSAGGAVVGIRLRYPDGRKLSVRGGREGLFLPAGLAGEDPLVICEGPTDTAALLDLGFDALGRPSCTGGVALLVRLVRERRPGAVGIVADADGPGQRGAGDLAAALAAHCRDVRVVTPPAGVKDAREWVRVGATRENVLGALDAARPIGLPLEVHRRPRS